MDYLLSLEQEHIRVDLAICISKEEGRQLLAQIPGYRKQWLEDIKDWEEVIDGKEMFEYIELEYNGHRIPFTSLTFISDERIDIVWRPLPNLSKSGEGLVPLSTQVDAYIIENCDLKEYLKKRSLKISWVEEWFFQKEQKVERWFRGSQDGEMLWWNDGEDWHALWHIDPIFIEQTPDEKTAFFEWIENEIKN